jgi:SAM-dependent methyltransferase
MVEALYDRIGLGYARHRRPDPRIAARIAAALGDAATVVNVGAGAGSYEPVDRRVVAVDPSLRMIRQRPVGAAAAIRATAERLPFRAGSFDAALAVLTLHHWRDWRRGVAELRRVARDRVVIFTWDPDGPGFWLVREYFPEVPASDRVSFPSLDELTRALGPLDIRPVPVPHDCSDGFLGAYWRRPERYLDPGARGAISGLAGVPPDDPRLRRLARDLEDGSWARRHRELATLQELDLGYRLVTARAG